MADDEATKLTPKQIREGLVQWMADANQDKYVHQVHEVVIREVDARDARPNYAVLIPLGQVLGIQIKNSTDDANNYPDRVLAEVFISMDAFASSLNALGLRLPAIHTCNLRKDESGNSQA